MANSPTSIKIKMQDILTIVSWADISRTYFGKSNSWLYHKLNGIDGNGKPTTFTDEEKAILHNALLDISAKLQNAASNI